MTFFGVLGLIFVVLKLVKVISWSWWLVLLPLYGPVLAIILLGIVAGAITALS